MRVKTLALRSLAGLVRARTEHVLTSILPVSCRRVEKSCWRPCGGRARRRQGRARAPKDEGELGVRLAVEASDGAEHHACERLPPLGAAEAVQHRARAVLRAERGVQGVGSAVMLHLEGAWRGAFVGAGRRTGKSRARPSCLNSA